MLKKIAESPWLHLASGLILLITSGIEVYRRIGEDTIGAHHGVFIFALIQIIQTLPSFHEAVEDISKKL